MESPNATILPVSRYQLFVTFSRITLSGFGGVIFWARRALVERQRLLSEKEFVELFTISQLIPGPPGLNLTVLVGHRFGGWSGAAAATSGFLLWPCLIVVGMGLFFQHYGTVPHVRRALAGMSIVAAALIFSTFIKMAKTLPRHWRPWFFALLAFAATAILRWPLFWVVGALAPLALWAAWKETDR